MGSYNLRVRARRHVTVVVLGDLGRSPRMLNHALALARHGFQVRLLGTGDSPIRDDVATHPLVRVERVNDLQRAPESASRWRFYAVTAARMLVLQVELFRRLLAGPRPEAIIVQTPPAVPLLASVFVAARLRRARAIVDWHNFGYAMLALRTGPGSALVRAARAYERFFGRRLHAHVCVSQEMRHRLERDFGITGAAVLYDRPLSIEPQLPRDARPALAARVLKANGIAYDPAMALVVAPTSWTADEDVWLLFETLKTWDAIAARQSLPRLLLLVTGRGPQRGAFEQRMSAYRFAHAELRTAFFGPQEYHDVLRAADLGVCLHRSASGADLPMKMVDFAGANLPACAYDYGPCLREQVEPGRTARLFTDGPELARQMADLLAGFPHAAHLDRMRDAIAASRRETWFEAWTRAALSVGLLDDAVAASAAAHV
jgi:beta-1,4-mannosyltransferase